MEVGKVQIIPLYPDVPTVASQDCEPRDLDPTCEACSLNLSAETVCMPARLMRGQYPDETLLVVGESPSSPSDRMARGFEGKSERWFRNMLRRKWQGNVVFDHALKCFRGKKTINESHHKHCRPHLAAILRDVDPCRIITLGNHAAKGLLGYDRGGSSHCNRRGYAWMYPHGGVPSRPVPVFLMSRPHDPSENRFYRSRFEDDLEWALTSSPPEPPLDAVTFALDPTKEDADFVLEYLKGKAWFSIDVETYGEPFSDSFRLLTVGISAPGEEDTVSWDEAALARGTSTRKVLRKILTSAKWIKKGQNTKYDHLALRLGLNVDMDPVLGDSRLQFKLLNPNGDAALDQMAEMVGMGGHKQEADLIVKKETARLRKAWREENPGKDARHYPAKAYAYAALPREVNLRYVSRDALSTTALIETFEKALPPLHGGRLWETYHRTVNPASIAVTNMEDNGIAINRESVEALGAYLLIQIHDVESKLGQHNNRVDWGSPKALAEYLYKSTAAGGLGIKPTEFTKTGQPSTAKATLERLAAVHPVMRHVLEWRRLTKLESTYVEGLLPFIRSDGRIHPTLLLDGTGTGRLSCKQPNLQNQPSRGGEEAKMVKDCFIAPDGRILLQADFSTLEIRVAALLSGDPKMIALLADPTTDFHLETAKMIAHLWGMTPQQVEDEYHGGDGSKRMIAKTINFGTLYGQSAFALALQITAQMQKDGTLDLGEVFPPVSAEKAQAAIFGEFTVLREWIKDRVAETRTFGEAWTVWDGDRARRRPLYEAGFSDGKRSGTAIRSAFNTPVQGSGSDYCLMSIVACDRAFRGTTVLPVLTVHDSILFEVDATEEAVESTIYTVNDIMTGWPSGDVPLKVDFELGPSWGSLKGLDVDEDGFCENFRNLLP